MLDKALQNFKQKPFKNHLINWFYKNKRELPWRNTTDPYAIWVSEIMLQQTKVDTVIHYYRNFMEHYPTIFELANASEQDVLKQWEGLGYYSRARNLHTAVKEVVATYDGVVPNDSQLLSKLKGIGPYTKGAIMSIAFNEPEPAVDGNVMRVLSRILLIEDNILEIKTRRRIEKIVREIISKDDPSAFNQGLMELGALICIPRSPRCEQCPVQQFCRAYDEGLEKELPIRTKPVKQKHQHYISICLFDENGNIAIEKRKDDGLLANMWQFPMITKELAKQKSVVELIHEKYGIEIKIEKKLGNIKHVFSHLIWHITAYIASVDNGSQKESSLCFVSREDLNRYPMSVAHKKIERLI